ncbi:hypothetical protein [Parasynechococcus sp.]
MMDGLDGLLDLIVEVRVGGIEADKLVNPSLGSGLLGGCSA